jgi:predicted aldo/keto reductase-like oxidoreductase
METIVLGRTGMRVHRFGFGGIPIQTVSEERAVETVRHALSRGVDFIDTSRAYTTSERRIGIALKDARQGVVIASKTPDRTWDGVRRDLAKSLSELDVSTIDLYQCHFVRDADDYARVKAEKGPLDCLRRAQQEGRIGYVGITSHSLDVLDRAVEDGLFDTIMVCFSFLEPKAAESLIPKALDRNIGVIAMKSFSGGVIEDADLALKFVLSQPGVVVIPGVESPELFDENWRVYAAGDYRLSLKEKEAIEAVRRRWDKAFCRRCDYCQPCTEGIPISVILHLQSIARRMGEASLEKEWLIQGIEAARSCSQCGECLDRCPYELPIPDLIRETLDWLDARRCPQGQP